MTSKNKMKWIIALLGLTMCLNSCKVQVYPQITDGSKAAGTLTVVYEYSAYSKPIVHWDEVKESTVSKCQSWGYKNAEFFGAGTNHCLLVNGYGSCIKYQVVYKCQCTDK